MTTPAPAPLSAEALMELLYEHVFRAAVDSTLQVLRDPPGRQPGAAAVARSDWFDQLAPDDKARVVEVARDAAHAALFGLFAVVDGARSVSGGFADEVRLLTARDGVTRDVSGDLHDVFSALAEERGLQ